MWEFEHKIRKVAQNFILLSSNESLRKQWLSPEHYSINRSDEVFSEPPALNASPEHYFM
jgi:hypothetical protein